MYNAPQYQQNYAPQGYGAPAMNYAGFWVRAGAYIIDAIIVGIVIGILEGILGNTIGSLLGLVAYIAYYAICFSSLGGRTLGQQVLGLRTIKADGSPMTLGAFLLYRIIGYIINGIIIYIGFIWAAFDSRKQTWGQKLFNLVTVKGA